VTSEAPNFNAAESDAADGSFTTRRAYLSDRALFLRKFLGKGRVISAAVPSSQALVAGLLRDVDFGRPATIIELGAGTGPVTEQIVDRLRPFHRFVAVENDPEFCRVLRRRFPETMLLEADAARIAEPLANVGIHKVDYVVSGLPTPSLPARTAVGLWRWLRRALKPNGLFLQITIAPLIYSGFYTRLFESVDYRMVWWNLPPGGIYRCSAPRHRLARPQGTKTQARRAPSA
jgi:phosphatidylethanolamine/phosphatidyl-N-methylethanolamine N-methyltransferase